MERARILIAEDDEDLRRVLRTGFEEVGAQVVEAESGLELMRLLTQSDPFDLVVSDVRMSWATGAQVLATARIAGIDTPFIVITGYRDEALRTSHANPDVRRLYDEFLGEPLGERSHELLHTHYAPRESY